MKNKPSLGFEVHYIIFLLDVNESCINMMNIYETVTKNKRYSIDIDISLYV